jgi:hypothetical protein
MERRRHPRRLRAVAGFGADTWVLNLKPLTLANRSSSSAVPVATRSSPLKASGAV